ncbi:hypothetical protein HK097_009907 [Rhizophlyctis rosea]|uniref:Carboxylic ester hydrolase n=1 Tax=Rhizophlyctis rosea TaxID=64517 RepID=A0AAD5SG55_9FUNG|nr:hypothetical protein HK097_009907 [Rhizophlyctis rosea]
MFKPTAVLGLLALTTLAIAQSSRGLQRVSNFGTNPSNLLMDVYIPDNLPSRPPLLLGIHWCTGSGEAFYSGTEWKQMADKYKFIVIYPSVTRTYGNKCYDVGSTASITHLGGSDSLSMYNMVQYALQTYNADSSRVFVTGHSSGGMSTQMMLGSYPEVFKAGAAFAGVPFACFNPPDASLWNGDCATGKKVKTASQWGDLVRSAYPGYSGSRPRVMLWHSDNDDVVYYTNFGEAIKQWTNVLGVSQSPSSTDKPQSTWTRTRYRDNSGTVQVEAVSVQGGGHNVLVPGMAQYVVDFFGLNQPSTGTPTTTVRTTTTGGNTQPTTQPGASCTDVAPSGDYTCAQQAGWGKCTESWMANYCNASCGRCNGSGSPTTTTRLQTTTQQPPRTTTTTRPPTSSGAPLYGQW